MGSKLNRGNKESARTGPYMAVFAKIEPTVFKFKNRAIKYSKVVDADISKTRHGKYHLRFVYLTDEDVDVLGRKIKKSLEENFSDLDKDQAAQLVSGLRTHGAPVTDYSGGEFSSEAKAHKVKQNAQPA
jgi:hypothetical protein